MEGFKMGSKFCLSRGVCLCTLITVNRIKEQYKVSVRIPQDSERSGLVRIEGDPKGVQLARRELIEMVQRMVGT